MGKGLIPVSRGGIPTALQIKVVTIANAAVRTLNATPVEVIPAPPSGYYIDVVSIMARLNYGSAAFDNVASGEDLCFKFTNASGAKVTTSDVTGVGFADQTANEVRLLKGAAVTPVAAAKVVASVLSGSWYSAAGDSSLTIESVYLIRQISP